MTNIKQKTITNMAWSVSERVSLQVIHILISIVLARLLEPSEFGLLGMLAIFTSIAQSILDSGFGSALIQKKDASQTDASSIFYFNLLIGIILSIIIFLLAPFIASFFNQPILMPVTRVLALNYIINAFSLVQFSMLKKSMRFKNHFIVTITAVIISGVSAIIAATLGLGVWSLVIQTLSLSIAQALLLWIFGKWRPIGSFSLASLKTMFNFGSKLLIAGLIETIFVNLYQTFIGKIYLPSDVGFYSRANQMQSAASVATSMALGQVIFPAFSPYQDDKETLLKVHRKIIKMSMFLIMPLMIGLIIIAKPLFLFLLTEKWADSILYFQLLSIIGILYPIIVQNYNLFRITGHTGLHLKLEIFKYSLTVIAILLTYRHGIVMLIIGQIAVYMISTSVASVFAGKLIGFKFIDQILDLLPIILVSFAMGLIVFFVGHLNISSNLLKFLSQIMVGIPVYYLINALIKSNELQETMDILNNFFFSLRAKLQR